MKKRMLVTALVLGAWCGDTLFNEGRLNQRTWRNAQDAGWAVRAGIARYIGLRIPV
jgi:hypothetical protein